MAWNKFATMKAKAKHLEAEVQLLTDECERMYKILDDISTAGDVHKPTINGYFKSVNSRVEKGLKDGLFYSDGYTIIRKQ